MHKIIRICRHGLPVGLILAIAGCGGSVVPHTQTPDASHNSTLSQAVFKETNRLRANPKAYGTVLNDVLGRISNDIYYPVGASIGVRMKEGTPAVKEAIKAIDREGPLPTLHWSDALARLARKHVIDTGAKGLVGHTGSSGESFSDRVSGVLQRENFSSVAENISYGLDDGRDVVAHLFIDDGVPGRGHRTNLLKKQLNYTGVACGYHQKYRKMCVAIYAYRAQ